jgi:peptide deformylase
MAIRPVVITGEPVLHRRAVPVEVIDDEIRALVADMFETMDAAHGVGLAAPQIGVGLRIFTWQMANDDGVPPRGVVINPFVVAAKPPAGDPDPEEESEGCLSVPGKSFPLRRGERATLTGQDLDGTELSYEATGWFARMFQHEYDHLNGFLYVDRLAGRWARKARKVVKEEGWGVPGLAWMPGVDRDPFGHDGAEGEEAGRHDDADSGRHDDVESPAGSGR